MRFAALLVVLVLAGCSAGTTYVAAPATARPAPAFELELLDGTTLDLAEQWEARPVVLVFFESWCELCARQQPDITALSEEYRDTVLFVGVGHESSGEDATGFAREHDIGYPVGIDPTGEVWRRYRVDEPPLVALISKGGWLVRGWPGGTTELGAADQAVPRGVKTGDGVRKVVWCAALSLVATVGVNGTAAAAAPGIVVEDGVTQPVFGYGDAIRERVFVDSPYDSDVDGARDVVAVDIMRPAASDRGLKVPVIMDPSPYYSTLGRGNEAELKVDADGDGLLDRWPLFYENYFVPRGYAVLLMDMIGTNRSTGCATIHEESDNLSPKVVIDWLNGRATARDATGAEVVADWHNGRTGLIGKSYDGTLVNGTAVSGVDGLATIVPITAISSYYDYTRSGGVVQRGNDYLASLANTITDPDRRAHCAPVRDRLSANDGDEHGDYTEFWHVRDYNRDVDEVRASVFVIHGLNDENVRPDHFSKWWHGLSENRVPRKLWLAQTGHVDPFDFRRGAWVDEVHRWFDHWLHGIDNGIMREPVVDVERAPDVWETAADWPVRGSRPTNLWLAPNTTTAGRLSVLPNRPSAPTLSFTDDPQQRESTMIGNELVVQPNRLAYVSAPLTAPLHVSGTPTIRLQASVDDVDTNFGAILVDYGRAERVQRTGDGVVTGTTENCWGETAVWGGFAEDACYREVSKRVAVTDHEVVTKGIVDALNINDVSRPTPLVPGRQYQVDFPLLPEDYVFRAGHRIGVIIVASYRDYGSQPDQNRATITVAPRRSLIELPIVGGHAAAVRAGLT